MLLTEKMNESCRFVGAEMSFVGIDGKKTVLGKVTSMEMGWNCLTCGLMSTGPGHRCSHCGVQDERFTKDNL